MDEFLDFAARILRVPRKDIKPETAYGELPQWDSIMHLRLVMEIEEEYGIDIPMDAVPNIKNLGQFLEYIERG